MYLAPSIARIAAPLAHNRRTVSISGGRSPRALEYIEDMFHEIPHAMLVRMRELGQIDSCDRTDGTSRVKRLRQTPPQSGQFHRHRGSSGTCWSLH